MKLRVEVTAEDWAEGVRSSPAACAIARAVIRASEGVLAPLVTASRLYLGPPDRQTIALPGSLTWRIHRFDNGFKDLLPVEFTLDLEANRVEGVRSETRRGIKEAGNDIRKKPAKAAKGV